MHTPYLHIHQVEVGITKIQYMCTNDCKYCSRAVLTTATHTTSPFNQPSNKAVCNSRRSFQAIATVHTYATVGSFQAMSSTIRHITACASHIYDQRTLSVFPPGLSTVLKIDPPAFHNAFPFINSVIHDLHRDAIKPRC